MVVVGRIADLVRTTDRYQFGEISLHSQGRQSCFCPRRSFFQLSENHQLIEVPICEVISGEKKIILFLPEALAAYIAESAFFINST